MNLIKKNVLMATVLLSLGATPIITHCESQDDDFEAYFNGLDSDANLDTMDPITKQFDPWSTILVLLDMNIVGILKQDLFLRTNPLNKRNILDQPMAALDKKYKYDDWVLGSNLFYNETNRCYFAQHCDAITSYLGITQDGLLEQLKIAAQKIKNLQGEFEFDPLDALMLLQNATISERQAGVLLWGEKQLPKWNVCWKLPFYYLERNYWLTDEEQQALEDEYGASTEDARAYLQKNLLVADKVGFGDFRIGCDTPLFASNDDRLDYRIGVQATIPTAFAIAQGILGNQFKLHPRKQNLDLTDYTCHHLDDLINMALDEEGNNDEAFRLLKNMGLCSLDTINAQLLEAPLGNSGHFGLGLYTKSYMPISTFIRRKWADYITYKGGMSLEYLFPATEKRMFVKKRNVVIDEFDARDFNDEDQAFQNMVFIEQQLVDKLFPFVYNTQVHPGIIFRWTGIFSFESYHWLLNLGTDTWIRSPEVLKKIEAPEDLLPKLKVDKANRLMGYQWKIVGGFGYKLQRKKHTWIFSVDADSAFTSSGIGDDYTLSFNVEVDF